MAREQDPGERAAWRALMAERDPQQFVFVDETHLTLSLTPLSGRAPAGERVVDAVPHRRWQSVSFLAALTPPPG